jgi:hypothetical protein
MFPEDASSNGEQSEQSEQMAIKDDSNSRHISPTK